MVTFLQTNETVTVMLDQASLHRITVFIINKPKAHNTLAEQKSLLMKNTKYLLHTCIENG